MEERKVRWIDRWMGGKKNKGKKEKKGKEEMRNKERKVRR